MKEVVSEALIAILRIIIPMLAILLGAWIRNKIGQERLKKIKQQLEIKENLALLAVRFVEQAYKDLKGPEKFDQAVAWMSNRAQQYGLALPEDEIKGLIEAVLRALKDEFSDLWISIPEPEESQEETMPE